MELVEIIGGAMGYAIANFAVGLGTLTTLTNKGILTREDAHDTIRRARQIMIASGGFPGVPESLEAAMACLDQLEQKFLADTAQISPSGLN